MRTASYSRAHSHTSDISELRGPHGPHIIYVAFVICDSFAQEGIWHCLCSLCRHRGSPSIHRWFCRSELDRPDRRLWAITFVVVHRFPKTRRFSSSLAVPELRFRAGCTTRCNFWGGLPAPASPGPSGRKTAARLPLRKPPAERGCCACFSELLLDRPKL